MAHLLAQSVTGVEPSDETRRIARYQHPDAVAQDLPLQDGSTDLMFTLSILQHMPSGDMVPVIVEVDRILANGGTVSLIEGADGKSTAIR